MRHNTNTLKALALSAIAALTLSACHSSNRHIVEEQPTPIVDEPSSYDIKVADGYLVGAFVFLDVDGDYTFDDDEPSGTTEAGGVIALDVEGIDNPEQYSIIAQATKTLTIDEDTGTFVDNDFAMSSPAGTTVVNPITTLVQAKIAAAQASGETLTVEAALESVATMLGFSADDAGSLLDDYLAPDNKGQVISKAIHAIARSVVTHLPSQAAALDHSNNAEFFTALETIAESIAVAVHEAIALGKDPDVIIVIVDSNGSTITTTPDVNDGKEFIADIRTWGNEISLEMATPAEGFSGKLDAASLLVESDIDLLVMTLDQVLMIIDEASMAGTLSKLTPAMLGDTDGSFSYEDISSDTTSAITAIADLTIEGNSIKFTVTTDAGPDTDATTSSGALTFTASLSNANVSLAVTEGLFEMADYIPATDTSEEVLSETRASLSMHVVAKTLTDNDNVVPTSFTGELGFAAVVIANESETEEYAIPTMFSLSGLFEAGEENFSASLSITSSGDFISENTEDLSFGESATNWLDATVTLDISTELDTISGASIKLEAERSALEDGLFSVVLTYGERSITLDINSADETGTVIATNDQGVMLTLKTLDVVDGEQVGQLLLGIKQIAGITLVNGIHMIRYDDGTFETLF